MNILIPEVILEKCVPAAQAVAPDANFLPYGNEDEAPAGLDTAEAMFCWPSIRILDKLVANAPKLRWLHTGSAGVERILSPTVRGREGLIITDSGPAFESIIPEFVMARILSVARHLPEFAAQQQRHEWKDIRQQDILGSTMGIIGLGPIGRGVAKLAKAFGMCTLGFRRTQAPVENVDEVLTTPDGLLQLLSKSDFVVLAAALTEESRSLIGASQLAAMKPTAWIVNIARGALIDEDALLDALQSDRIGGACLDVFVKEPLPSDHPFWDLHNVQISPHDSPDTDSLRSRQIAIFTANLERFVRNEPLDNVVDVARGY